LYCLLLTQEDDDKDVAPTTTVVNFTSLTTSEEVADVAPQQYIEAVDKMLVAATAANSGALLKANVSGTITLLPSLFSTTDVSLTAEISFDASAPTSMLATYKSKVISPAFFKGKSKVAPSSAISPPPLSTEGPVSLSSLFLKHFISSIPGLHARFARDDQIDEAALQHFEDVIVPTSPQPSPDEVEFTRKMLLCDDRHSPDSGWYRIPGSVQESVDYYQKSVGGDSAWGSATTIIDASAALVCGYLWTQDTYARISRHYSVEGQGAFWKTVVIPNSRSLITTFLVSLGGGLSDRLFSLYLCWTREENGEFILAFADLSACSQRSHVEAMESLIKLDKKASAAVRGTLTGIYRIMPIAKNVCRITLVSQGMLGGQIPSAVMNMRIKSTLGIVKRLRDKYERKDKEIDKEVRDEYSRPSPVSALTAEQREIYARCRALEKNAGGSGWIDISYSSPLVKMSMKHVPPQRGERSVALGMCEGVIDCSLLEACAWWGDFCSRERMRISGEEGNPARLIASRSSAHDCVVATIKRFPFPLYPREYVARQFSAVDDDGDGDAYAIGTDIVFATESVKDKVDYGVKIKTVPGIVRAFTRLTSLSATQCKVVLYQYADAGGIIPVSVANTLLPLTISAVDDLRVVFARDDEIDAGEHGKLARIIREVPQEYSTEENGILNRLKSCLIDELGVDHEFPSLDSPDPRVQMGFAKTETGGITWGQTVVDATPECCLAWDLLKTSRAFTKDFVSRRGGVRQSLVKTNDHNYIFYLVINLNVPGFLWREWVTRACWKWDGNTLVMFAEASDLGEVEGYPRDPACVRASAKDLWQYDVLPSVGGVPQTRVTRTQQVDLKGSFPKGASKLGAISQLLSLSRMRRHHDQSLEIDAANRARIMDYNIEKHADAYSEEENKIVEEGEALFARFKDNSRAKLLKMTSPLATAKVAFEAGDPLGWGWARTTIRAVPEEVLAFIWDTLKRSAARDDDLEKSVDETINGHNQLVYVRKAAKRPLSDREFLGRAVWKATESGFIYVLREEESNRRPPLPGVVRGTLPSVMKLTRLKADETAIEYVIHPNAGGSVPGFVMNLQLAKNLQRVTEAQEYFQSLRGLALWDVDDGRAVGEVMVIKTKAEKHREKGETKVGARMRDLFEKHRALREIGAKYEFFETMMARVLQNKLRPVRDVSAKLSTVSLKQGNAIGAGLALSLASSLTAEAAVDEWIGKYPALKELDREEVWFRPLVNTVALRLLGEVSWGLKMRVFLGAFLSLLDVGSDVTVVLLYSNNPDEEKYALLLVGMIATCLALQLIATLIQHRKASLVRLMGELLIVLTGLKPG
jgi:hypothetical protein